MMADDSQKCRVRVILYLVNRRTQLFDLQSESRTRSSCFAVVVCCLLNVLFFGERDQFTFLELCQGFCLRTKSNSHESRWSVDAANYHMRTSDIVILAKKRRVIQLCLE